MEVVGALEGPGESEGAEEEGRDDGGDDEAEQLARAVLDVDEEHQRSEEELAAQIDDLPEEEVGVVVPPEEAAGSGEGGDPPHPHCLSDREQQREEYERDAHRPQRKEAPEVHVEASVVLVIIAAKHVGVGHEVAAPLPGEGVREE